MKNILIIGAGRSSGAVIEYLLNLSKTHDWNIVVADNNLILAKQKIKHHETCRAVQLDINNKIQRQNLIKNQDLVISLLPASLHHLVAYECLDYKVHLITASYVSKNIKDLHKKVAEKGLLFMGEMGLDPGIDHMSAMQKIHEIQAQNGDLISFKSYTGGLIAAESNDNPWQYKFTWNPRNIVLAGQSTAQYRKNGIIALVPYSRLFKKAQTLEIEGIPGQYEAYANRDSLKYINLYGLEGIPTIIRGTIRYQGFSKAWDALATIGLTDHSYPLVNSENMTYKELMSYYTFDIKEGRTVKEKIAILIGEDIHSVVMDKLEWLGLFKDDKIGVKNACPADALEILLLKKWQLKDYDKDLIVMQHEFEYKINGQKQHLTSNMMLIGKNSNDTAMGRLVGLPLGILAKHMMLGHIKLTGVQIPVMPQVYNPVLKELEDYGVKFNEYIKTTV